ncbi:excalibur calcium-binding domain-containing protein [Novosphingobium gossypii]|uniref:excalibur calcium-binding domain-containing protein n=1 Tax=Novosphingobium gossypii TaxID=1604774 RepID=UPI003D1EEF88
MSMVKVVGASVLVGVVIASAVVAFEKAQDRSEARAAVLSTLPQGYEFPGCNEVRRLGLDPLYSNEPGYSIRMDGDGDGIACEVY